MGDISEDEYNSSKVEFKSQLDKIYLMLEHIQNKEFNILKLNKLSKDYNKILDTYEQLLTENPQELFNKIEYIKTNKIIDLIKDKSKCNITEEG